MRIGFWLDWNSDITDEIETHTQWLKYVFDDNITPVIIAQPIDVAMADCDMLTFDYGGICGGYGPNEIVPILIASVVRWCEKNPDRLALLWCTFPPEWYLGDFKRFGGVPSNLRCAYRVYNDSAIEQELRAHYAFA